MRSLFIALEISQTRKMSPKKFSSKHIKTCINCGNLISFQVGCIRLHCTSVADGNAGKRKLFIDNSDIVWVGTSRGICKYNGKSWITVTEKGSPIEKHVFCIATDSNQNIWFGTWENGIYKYDGKSWCCFTNEDGLADNFVNDITLDPDGRLWFGTNSGLSCFDGQIWTSYSTEQGLASNIINSLAIAPNGVLWIGTTGGLSCMNLTRIH